MDIHTFLDTLQLKTGKQPRKSGSGYSACCPAHDDTTPSLSISEGPDGKILLHCFAGCTIDSVCGSLNLAVSDLFQPYNAAKKTSSPTVYSYKDEQGCELFRKIRIEPQGLLMKKF